MGVRCVSLLASSCAVDALFTKILDFIFHYTALSNQHSLVTFQLTISDTLLKSITIPNNTIMGSINKSHTEPDGGLLLFSGELILLYCDSVSCEIGGKESVST